jgi:Recombination endonuclease VII
MPSGYTGSTPQATCHPDRKMHCKELCKECYFAKYNGARVKTDVKYPSHTPEAKRRSSLGYLGWTPELFSEVLSAQEEKCAICKRALRLSGGAGSIRACADHEHIEPPKPRGILCGDCNTGIGKLQDNPEILRAAAAYVEKFSLATAEETQTTTYPINPTKVGKTGKRENICLQ